MTSSFAVLRVQPRIMKNLIKTFCIIFFSATLAMATGTPESLISTDEIDVVTVESNSIFVSADFDTADENLEFTTATDIAVIQIFNAEGEMEFVLPVQSTIVKINKNLLSPGVSKLGFVLQGESNIHFTEVTVK